MKKIQYTILSATFLFIYILTEQAYSEDKSYREVRNLDGKIVKIPRGIKRAACFYGPSYEKVFLLNAEHKIAACSEFHLNSSPWARKIFKRLDELFVLKGGYDKPNLEELLEMKLDVIFFWSFPNAVSRIEGAGIPVIHPRVSGNFQLEDAKNLLKFYAEVLGPEEVKIAEKYCVYFDKKFEMLTAITSKIPEKQRPRIYSAVRTPFTTGGRYSGIPDVVECAGGMSVQRNLEAGFGREISVEQLIEWNPDIIIIDHCGARFLGSKSADQTMNQIYNDNRLSNISAVKDQKVYISPTGVFFWDSGQQVILQMMWMAKLFHPDKFRHIDMNNELKVFYSEFFRYDLTDDEAYRILTNMAPED